MSLEFLDLTRQVLLLLSLATGFFLVELNLFIFELDLGRQFADLSFLLALFLLQFELGFAHFVDFLLQRSDTSLDDFGAFLGFRAQLVLHLHQLGFVLSGQRILLPHEVSRLVEDHPVVVIADLTDELVCLAERLLELADFARFGDQIVVKQRDLGGKLRCHVRAALELDVFHT